MSEPISPASSNPFFAAITAIISFITAAAAIVPRIICVHSSAAPESVDTAIPVISQPKIAGSRSLLISYPTTNAIAIAASHFKISIFTPPSKRRGA